MPDFTSEFDVILTTATKLFEAVELENRSIRLLGISLSNLENRKQIEVIQLPLFSISGMIF